MYAAIAIAAVIATFFLLLIAVRRRKRVTPLSVNYFFTRDCNYKCGFCFHTATNSFILHMDEIRRGLTLLQRAGMKKINFAGNSCYNTLFVLY
jgi:2-iminoacetate synthase ThiH